MRIVLDSTVLIDDYYMRGSHFRVLLDRLPRLEASLLIPQVVVEETVNKFCEHVGELSAFGAKYDRKFEQLFITEEKWDSRLDAEECAKTYRNVLLTEILRPVRHEIIPYPRVTHQSIVARALGRRKPFDTKGRAGYRDSLIWETVLGLLKDNSAPLCFVTNNSADFGQAPQLHDELREDLSRSGLSHEVIRFYSSIADLNNSLVLPELPHRADMVALIQEERLPEFSLYEWAKRSLLYLLARLGAEHLAPDPIPVDLTQLLLAGAARPLQIDGVFELTSGNLLLSATIQLAIDLRFRPTKLLLESKALEELFPRASLEDDSIGDAELRIDLRPLVRVTLILEIPTYKVLAETVDEIEVQVGPLHKVRKFHPHPVMT